ncbi:hypothetical protein ILUMI_00200 [Ignelater luminosus]|uniref:triacylglycerol lipase n=1 Tax=Ignelater luminosus TaxID=2038154 RepID=A0A8K0GMV1_IGNLU|nr:hypothetical protein ILUMI_00200 [Ignelater luminosus]
MNLSFAGCGFLGIYHVGVACCFKKYAPHLLLNKISGASAGAIAACCLLCDLPLGDITSDVLRVAIEARSGSLGPFSPSFNIQNLLLEGLEKFLPDDAHIRVSGKLHISLTRVYDGKNVIISHFESREDLLQALLASAFIPVFSGILPPKFHGVRYMDGGFSDNLPALDENTITVSPFCGETDICPRDDSSQLFHINVANTSIELSRHNIYRIARILFPPKPEILSNMCKQGFDDALRFLHRNNLINCTRCLAVQSTFVVSEALDDCYEYDPECHECKIHRQEALVSNMPDTVMTIFQEAIDSANKGLVNWMFRHRGMKLLSVLSLPYTLPADIMYATFTKFMSTAPVMGNGLWDLSKFFTDQFSSLLSRVNSHRQQLTAKISCQLAITEYGGNKYDVESCQDLEARNKMNLNFTLNLDEDDLPIDQSPGRKFKTKKVLSRQPSLIINRTDTGDEDTFEHILQVTSHHEAIMAYYYMDENNKVKVTEIFDVTDSDSAAVQTSHERELNKQLEFDDDWDESTWTTQQAIEQPMLCGDEASIEGMSEYSLEDILDRDTSNIFSDPESEWTGTFKIEEPEDELSIPEQTTDTRPESDQPAYYDSVCRKPYRIPSFNYDDLELDV